MIKVLIVDDESLARIRLQRLLDKKPDIEIVGEARNGLEAVRMAHQYLPGIVLMDVRMPEMDGLEAARQIAKMVPPPAVIFCTAFEDFALRAFDAKAFAYLLKPIKSSELDGALQRAASATRAQLDGQTSSHRRHLCSRTHNGLELVAVEKIRLLQADQKYVTAYTVEGESVLSDTLKDIEKEFSQFFVRVHRSALVARNAIEGLTYAEGHLAVKLRGIAIQPIVSRRLESKLRQLLPQL
ncbi:Transcriptional regulatory protein YehT [Gammaproteobacteria bacterium MOLA455]|nr:Transcriptional regulatory protein YehT [Gammaproteobacteria bacterium MOLA455]